MTISWENKGICNWWFPERFYRNTFNWWLGIYCDTDHA